MCPVTVKLLSLKWKFSWIGRKPSTHAFKHSLIRQVPAAAGCSPKWHIWEGDRRQVSPRHLSPCLSETAGFEWTAAQGERPVKCANVKLETKRGKEKGRQTEDIYGLFVSYRQALSHRKIVRLLRPLIWSSPDLVLLWNLQRPQQREMCCSNYDANWIASLCADAVCPHLNKVLCIYLNSSWVKSTNFSKTSAVHLSVGGFCLSGAEKEKEQSAAMLNFTKTGRYIKNSIIHLSVQRSVSEH